jgi:hypothetical protein
MFFAYDKSIPYIFNHLIMTKKNFKIWTGSLSFMMYLIWTMWDFKFSRRWLRSSESSGMYSHVHNWIPTDVSEICAASIIRMGGSTYLWNVVRNSIKNTVVHPRRFWPSLSELLCDGLIYKHRTMMYVSYTPSWLWSRTFNDCQVRMDCRQSHSNTGNHSLMSSFHCD